VIEALRPIAEAIRARGGRAIAVGGFVRDHLLGRPESQARDLDVEVFGLGADDLTRVLRGFGEVLEYGRAFPVLRVVGYEIDFSIAPVPDFADAARRRDLTIHAIGLDPLSGELLDPLGGRADLAARVLRAADSRTFGSDPLRGLRVAQVAARFAMEPDAELVGLCRALDLSQAPGERLRIEWDKLLLGAPQPSRGLAILRRTGLVRFFPELAALIGVSQDPRWHPEGDVWIHTELVVDAAAALRTGGPDDAALVYASLCHDFGKPATTTEKDGRVRSHGHESGGVALARAFLERLRMPNALVAQVLALVEHHRAPAQLPRHHAKPAAYRRLVRRIGDAGVTAALLERVARADHLGRTTEAARARSFPEGDEFLAAIAQLALSRGGPPDVVSGRHLVARGLAPGPAFADILARCRDVQDETGSNDPETILRRVLESGGPN
jgi:tRNA nucleotidyltransferase (CCA-adding enzyme)